MQFNRIQKELKIQVDSQVYVRNNNNNNNNNNNKGKLVKQNKIPFFKKKKKRVAVLDEFSRSHESCFFFIYFSFKKNKSEINENDQFKDDWVDLREKNMIQVV